MMFAGTPARRPPLSRESGSDGGICLRVLQVSHAYVGCVVNDWLLEVTNKVYVYGYIYIYILIHIGA